MHLRRNEKRQESIGGSKTAHIRQSPNSNSRGTGNANAVRSDIELQNMEKDLHAAYQQLRQRYDDISATLPDIGMINSYSTVSRKMKRHKNDDRLVQNSHNKSSFGGEWLLTATN
ncbi:hypothetical protein PS6_010600 [Mucor atramentarius]